MGIFPLNRIASNSITFSANNDDAGCKMRDMSRRSLGEDGCGIKKWMKFGKKIDLFLCEFKCPYSCTLLSSGFKAGEGKVTQVYSSNTLWSFFQLKTENAGISGPAVKIW